MACDLAQTAFCAVAGDGISDFLRAGKAKPYIGRVIVAKACLQQKTRLAGSFGPRGLRKSARLAMVTNLASGRTKTADGTSAVETLGPCAVLAFGGIKLVKGNAGRFTRSAFSGP